MVDCAYFVDERTHLLLFGGRIKNSWTSLLTTQYLILGRRLRMADGASPATPALTPGSPDVIKSCRILTHLGPLSPLIGRSNKRAFQLLVRVGLHFLTVARCSKKTFRGRVEVEGATCRHENLRQEMVRFAPPSPPFRHARSRSTNKEFAVVPAGGSVP